MRHLFTRSMFILLALIGLMTASPAYAQTSGGKTGTTITIDGENCKGLFSEGASTTACELYGYIRHTQAPIQVVASNYTTRNDYSADLLKDYDNNIMFATDGTLALCRGAYKETNKTDSINKGVANLWTSYFAVVAPKGYKITRLVLDVDVSSTKNFTGNGTTGYKTPDGAVFTEYTYNADGSISNIGKSLTVNTSSNENTLDITKSGSGCNKIFLSLYVNGDTNGNRVIIKSMKITYVIDDPFTELMPNDDGEASVHTGFIDLGEFSSNGIAWTFQNDNVTDKQKVTIYSGNEGSVSEESPSIVSVDGNNYFVAATNGDYYIEAPSRFRVIGATVNFLSSNVSLESSTSYETATAITSGNSYIITDGSGHYLNNNNGSIAVGTDLSTASKWTITGSNGTYTVKNGSYYLYRSYSSNLSLSTWSNSWSYDSTNGLYQKSSYGNTTYYLYYNGSSWGLATSASSANVKLQEEVIKEGAEYTAGNFTGSVYERTGNTIPDGQKVSIGEGNASGSITVSDFNNDAIRINISGLSAGETALYNVELKLLPLDPEVQAIDVAYKGDDGEASGNVTVTSENFVFATNESSTAYIPVPAGADSYAVVFRNAVNEQPSKWYSDGSKDNNAEGYSNYFLVNSTADKGGITDVLLDVDNSDNPYARINADQAGTAKLDFTNIGEFVRTATTTNPTALIYNKFSKQDAAYGEVAVPVTTNVSSPSSKTVYVYTSDQPTFNILEGKANSKHIDYRYYSVTVVFVATKAEPKVEVTPIYTSTLKGANNKNSNIGRDDDLDESHTFFGVTVKATLNGKETSDGVLSSQQIKEAVKSALASYATPYGGFTDSDPYRGVLYIDMSALKGSDNTALTEFNGSTADNCLYFMYSGYAAPSGILNSLTKQTDGTYEASSDIKIYDQQPFFTPYGFKTGSHVAIYEREGTHGKATVQQMSCMLPFDINLDSDGHPMLSSDNVDSHVTFREIVSSGQRVDNRSDIDDPGYAFAVVADAVTSGIAKANEPYHVMTDVENGGFTFSIMNANFIQTPVPPINDGAAVESDMTHGETWVGHGTFAGKRVEKADTRFIFSSNVYHKTGAQKVNQYAYITPFRAYFDATDANVAKTDGFCVVTSMDGITTGIADVNVHDGSLSVKTQRGIISVTAGKQTAVRIYSVGGQLVGSGTVKGGQTASYQVAQGVYIVNGVKVVVE